MDMEAVRKRIKSALKESYLKGNISALARALTAQGATFDRSAISRIITGDRDIKLNEINAIADALRVDPRWLEYGDLSNNDIREEPRRVSLEEEAREDELERARYEAATNGHKVLSVGAIPEIDVMAGAGHGTLGEVVSLKVGEETVSAHRIIDEWVFPDGYLSSVLNVSHGRTLILPVVGDSMIPTYQPGDRILVDLQQSTMTIDAVYVISDGESPPQIKRLQRVLFSQPQMVDIISDNSAHSTQRVELDRLAIIGRVAGKVSKQ